MLLKLKDINAYYGYVHALKNVSIEVPEGKIVTLLGSNGAGKTSTLKVISGLLTPRDGSVDFAGKSLLNVPAEKVVALGIVQSPEGRQIFSEFSVDENLQVGAYSRRDKQVNESLARVYRYFPRLADRRKQIAGTLSGGEQQMLAIGRALMAQPKLLLLDEPSLGLAPMLVKDIFKIIKEINKEGTTILLVEQNAYQALTLADYAYVLETGKVVLEGSAAELRSNEQVKKAYLGVM